MALSMLELSHFRNDSMWRGGRLARGMHGSIVGAGDDSKISIKHTKDIAHTRSATNSRETVEKNSVNIKLRRKRSGRQKSRIAFRPAIQLSSSS